MTPGRFLAPWSVEQLNDACFIVKDSRRAGSEPFPVLLRRMKCYP
jgi:hypothetical protein